MNGPSKSAELAVAIALAVGIASASASISASADPARFALVIGNNEGIAQDAPLRHAERDAARFAQVLTDLGGVPSDQLVLLRGANAAAVRSALGALETQVAVARGAGQLEATLIIYYSGHGDATSLHLAGTKLPLKAIEQAMASSAAALRIGIFDACRAGAVTTAKGAQARPPIALALDPSMAQAGMVFIASSAEHEASHESDELRGSFFTHFLISGLMGAADENRDDRVTLAEAYAHAYQHTLRTTSASAGGAQHATFRFELRGHGETVLTTLGTVTRGVLEFPRGHAYLVLAGRRDGAVLGEVAAAAPRRQLSLAPGSYFLRGRAEDSLLEGMVTVRAGEVRRVDPAALRRLAYAQLVRKGAGTHTISSAVMAGYGAHTALGDAGTSAMCHGPFAGWQGATQRVTLAARVAACRATDTNDTLRADTRELSLVMRATIAKDVKAWTLEGGVTGGPLLLAQRFVTTGKAPARLALAAQLGVTAGVARQLPRGYVMGIEADAATYFYRAAEAGSSDLRARAAFGLAARFMFGRQW